GERPAQPRLADLSASALGALLRTAAPLHFRQVLAFGLRQFLRDRLAHMRGDRLDVAVGKRLGAVEKPQHAAVAVGPSEDQRLVRQRGPDDLRTRIEGKAYRHRLADIVAVEREADAGDRVDMLVVRLADQARDIAKAD